MSEFWPDFEIPAENAPSSPKEIIRRAGDELAKKTKGTVQLTSGTAGIYAGKLTLNYSLWVPSLLYAFPFLKATFPVPDLYPAELTADKIQGPIIATNEADLIQSLARIFHADTTVATVRQLIVLAK